MDFAKILAAEFHIQPWQTEAVIRLLDEGNTLPFIARYRKEQHGELDDQELREISERLEQLRALDARRQEIAASLTKLEVWTEELQHALDNASTMGELEDIYRPYRPKRRTRAMIAKEKGLEPLCDLLQLQTEKKKSPDELAQAFVDAEKGVEDAESALAGAMDILAERISDDAKVRAKLKALYQRTAQVQTKAAKEEDSVYRMYYDYQEPLRLMASHRVLAMNRGEAEGFLKVNIAVDTEMAERETCAFYVRPGSTTTPCVESAAKDAYNRLIAPSVKMNCAMILPSARRRRQFAYLR